MVKATCWLQSQAVWENIISEDLNTDLFKDNDKPAKVITINVWAFPRTHKRTPPNAHVLVWFPVDN